MEVVEWVGKWESRSDRWAQPSTAVGYLLTPMLALNPLPPCILAPYPVVALLILPWFVSVPMPCGHTRPASPTW